MLCRSLSLVISSWKWSLCSLIRTVLQLDNIRATKLETTCWG